MRRAEERWEEYEPEYWTDYEPYLDDEGTIPNPYYNILSIAPEYIQ